MLTTLRKLIQKDRCESGQVIVLATAFLFLALAVAAMVLDGGFFLRARRDTQNTADAAALAGAQHLPDDPVAAEDAALSWASRNGWTNGVDGVTVSVAIPYDGTDRKIEVVVAGDAKGSYFFDALADVESRAVAEVVITSTGPGGGDPGDPGGGTPMAPAPVGNCGSDNAAVDGRVMPGEGYEKFADLVGESDIHFGEAFFACDSGYYYFALRLNGPSTGGGVANENVYACRVKDECSGLSDPTYHVTYDTGWDDTDWGEHSFKRLILGDRARFQVTCGNAAVHDFVQDYLHEDGSGWASDTNGDGSVIVEGPEESSSSLVFNLENPDVTHWGDDPGENPLEQSPPFSAPGSYPDYDSEYDGWVWEMLYEFKVPRSAYDGCPGVFFGIPPLDGETGPVGGMHNSPAKVAEGVFVGIGEQTIEIFLVE